MATLVAHFTILASCAGATACDPSAPAVERVLFVGDSNTADLFGLPTWGGRASAAVGAEPFVYAKPGWTSVEAFDEGVASELVDGFRLKVVMLGTNDAVRSHWTGDPSAVLRLIWNLSEAISAGAVVVCPVSSLEGKSNWWSPAHDEQHAICEWIKANGGYPNGVDDNPTYYLEDGVHLNALGRDALADTVAEILANRVQSGH